MLVMHHHNIMHSSYGGKNMSRFIVPHGATVFGPAIGRKAGSQHEPNGAVYAPVFMGALPWNKTEGKRVECTGEQLTLDLGALTNYSCLSAVDLGSQFGWYPGVNYAVWRGDTDKHCHLCKLPSPSSEWKYVDAIGAWSYPYRFAEGERARAKLLKKHDFDGDGRIDPHDLRAAQDTPLDDDDDDDEEEEEREEAKEVREGQKGQEEDQEGEEGEDERDGLGGASLSAMTEPGVSSGGGPQYLLKNLAFGSGWNWTYQELPPHLQDKGTISRYATNPALPNSVYAVTADCISRSDDRGDTWGDCWTLGEGPLANFTGAIAHITFKDDKIMFLHRGKTDILRTLDGGASWHILESVSAVAKYGVAVTYSWSGKTFILHGNGGEQSADHPHTAYLWKSMDDGDTWTDETDDIVTNSWSPTAWYENTLYMSSMGQGIFAKDME